MVFSTAAAETALVMPLNFEVHLDDFTTALTSDDELHASIPGLDWLQSAMHDEHDILGRFSPSQTFHEEDWDEVILNHAFDADLSTTSGSGLSSPTDSLTFDSEEFFEESASPVKRKASQDSDDDIIAVKKAKVKKMTGSLKTRRVHDEITARTIAVLRAESIDNPDSRRRIHNVLERKRRNDLKTSYDELRECIPELETSDRAPTGQILAKAVELIAELQDEDKRMEAAIAALRAENERIRASLVV